MKTPIASVLLLIVASFLGALGQFLFKFASDKQKANIFILMLDYRVIAGILCYFFVMMIFTYAYKIGGQVKVLYPIYASTFIWAALMSKLFFNHNITWWNISGMLLLALGMYLMGKS